MHKNLVTTFFLIAGLTLLTSPVNAQSPKENKETIPDFSGLISDTEHLIRFRDSEGGWPDEVMAVLKGWGNPGPFTNWQGEVVTGPEEVCEWSGVQCLQGKPTGGHKRITRLNFGVIRKAGLNAMVRGNICELVGITFMERFVMGHLGLTGDISCLSKWVELYTFVAEATELTGDVKVFAPMHWLRYLMLGNATGIYGNVQDLGAPGMFSLSGREGYSGGTLDIRGTSIGGEVKPGIEGTCANCSRFLFDDCSLVRCPVGTHKVEKIELTEGREPTATTNQFIGNSETHCCIDPGKTGKDDTGSRADTGKGSGSSSTLPRNNKEKLQGLLGILKVAEQKLTDTSSWTRSELKKIEMRLKTFANKIAAKRANTDHQDL